MNAEETAAIMAAYKLARAHGHAWGQVPPADVEEMGLRSSDREAFCDALEGHPEWPEDGGWLPSWGEGSEADTILHTTASGRLQWRVWPALFGRSLGGELVVSRPWDVAAIRLLWTDTPREGRRVVLLDVCEPRARHVRAADWALEALGLPPLGALGVEGAPDDGPLLAVEAAYAALEEARRNLRVVRTPIPTPDPKETI